MSEDRIAALDGVRGLAVAAVVLFHVDLLRGGWVGVDVFFVLSGFLITTLLLGERDRTGRIALRAFWKRRIRRLMPALLVVVAAVSVTWTVAGRVTGALRADVVSTLGYVANWHFVRSGESYFATFEPSPLRHAWSLAIEEQFYVVWPLVVVLVLVRVRPWRRVGAVAVAATASTWWMHHVSADPEAMSRAYYGSDTRASTILVGCLAALVLNATRGHATFVSALCRRSGTLVTGAALGLAGIAVTVPEDARWLYRSGGFAIVAIAAGVLVVAAAHVPPGAVSRVLASRALVRLGLISYSLYLWHWPVLVLLDGTGLANPSRAAVAVGVSIALAEVSFRVVEQPVRRLRPARPAVAVGGSVAVVFALTMAATAGSVQGSPGPDATSGTLVARPPQVAVATTTSTTSTTTTTAPVRLVALSADHVDRQAATTTTTMTTSVPAPPPLELPLDLVVLGDSVAWMVAGRPAPDLPFAVRGTWHAKCDIVGRRLFLGDRVNEEDANCPSWPDEWATALDGPTDAVIVVLGLRQLFDLEVDGRRVAVASHEWDAQYRAAVGAALDVIRSRTAAPVFWFDVPCYQWAAAGTAGEEHDAERRRVVNEVLRATLAADPHVTVADYGARVCNGSEPIPDLRPDGAHLTEAAGHDIWRWLAPQVLEAVENAR